jgi:hypothetical protein
MAEALMRRETSIRSRTARPTVARRQGERAAHLPVNGERRRKQEKRLQRHAGRKGAEGVLRDVAQPDALGELGRKRAFRLGEGGIDGRARAGPGPQGGDHDIHREPARLIEAEDLLKLRRRAFQPANLGDATRRTPSSKRRTWTISSSAETICSRIAREGSSSPAISTIVSSRARASRGLLA